MFPLFLFSTYENYFFILVILLKSFSVWADIGTKSKPQNGTNTNDGIVNDGKANVGSFPNDGKANDKSSERQEVRPNKKSTIVAKTSPPTAVNTRALLAKNCQAISKLLGERYKPLLINWLFLFYGTKMLICIAPYKAYIFGANGRLQDSYDTDFTRYY